MSKGPRIKPTVRQVIVVEALKGCNKNKPRGQLAMELEAIIGEKGMGEIVPGRETLLKLISRARNHPVSPLDSPWSLARLAEYEISPEALPVVLQIWRQRLAYFGPLTIRQAQWVARLYRLIPTDVVLIAHWAELYALWERMGNVLEQEFESSAFDAALVMRPWELITAILTDKIKPDECFGMLPIDELLRLSNETYVDTREEIDRVHLLWQYYFRKGPRWDNLNEKTQHNIEIQLRKWVLGRPWIEDGEWLQRYIDKDLSLEDLDNNPLFKPTELLKVVGYEANAKEVTKEA